MIYEIINIEHVGYSQDSVLLTREDGSFESFPVDHENPRYIQFQSDLAAEQQALKTTK